MFEKWCYRAILASHMIKLQTLWTFVFYSFSFSLQPLPLSPSVISSTVFKQTAIFFHNFSTNKRRSRSKCKCICRSQKQICSLSSTVFYSFFTFFFFLGRSNVGDYFEQCFVIFQEPLDSCSILKTGPFDCSSKGSLKN